MNKDQNRTDEERKALIYEKYFSGGQQTGETKGANATVSWELFKKQYYTLEARVKKHLENYNKILRDFSKKTSSIDIEANLAEENNESKSLLTLDSLQNEYKESTQNLRAVLNEMKEHLSVPKFDTGDQQAFIKQNMLQRFKEIHQEHEKEYLRILNTLDYQMKKLELMRESVAVGRGQDFRKAGGQTELNNRSKNMLRENESLTSNLRLADELIKFASENVDFSSLARQKL
eukprot:TRINITY_DN2154_c0_g1_i18.p1 TRINITY_DN2154_c0_g1~~TRINITY_DN2154_c0_g1_i18.p1  ORF type:complete len:232 (-),score=42.01 TRINITY_DN2154_c0_g1_i18:288-983(-)